MNNLAWLYAEKEGRLAEAKRLAEKASEEDPNEPGYLDTLGWIQYKLGDYAAAGETLKTSLTAGPNEPIVHYHIGMVYLKLGDREKGKIHLEEALKSGKEFTGIQEARKTLSQMK